jgi:hypothetical protein
MLLCIMVGIDIDDLYAIFFHFKFLQPKYWRLKKIIRVKQGYHKNNKQ